MRYWFESVDDERDVGKQIAMWERAGKIRMIEKGDPYEQVKEKLHKIRGALRALREHGINDDVMQTYVYAKCSGVKKADVQAVLRTQQEFFRKMGLR